jgi:3-oxoacyl-(acyl-carrier-protein) synthase
VTQTISQSQDPPRVCITGMGLHSGFGNLEHTWSKLENGLACIKSIRLEQPVDFPEFVGASALDFSLDELRVDRKLQKYMNRASALAVLAAGRALVDARILGHEDLCADTALFVSTGLIAFDFSEVLPAMEVSLTADRKLDYRLMGEEGLRQCHPLMPFRMLLNMPLGLVSIAFGLRGENFVVYSGSNQGGVCLEKAFRGIRTRRFSRALVGGCVQSLSLMPLCSWSRMGRLARTAEQAIPYQKNHQGLAPADVGAFLLLESEDAANERNARIIGQLTHISVQHKKESLLDYLPHLPVSQRPDLILTTGNESYSRDLLDQQALESISSHDPPHLASFDGQLGYYDAAAIPATVVLGLQWMQDKQGPLAFQRVVQKVLISANESPVGQSWLLLQAMPEKAAS